MEVLRLGAHVGQLRLERDNLLAQRHLGVGAVRRGLLLVGSGTSLFALILVYALRIILANNAGAFYGAY